jgi:hypothetical protein
MKYYIGEYWRMMNSSDSTIREEGKKRWDEATKQYGPYFELIKRKLPKRFLAQFLEANWFHDFGFESIRITNQGRQIATVEFILTHGDISYKLVMFGVTGFRIDVPNTKSWLFGKMIWGYVEFELLDEKTWIIRILCDMDCEIEVMFRRIQVAKIKT